MLSRDVPDSPLRFGALWGLWAFHTVSTEHQTARQFAEECVALGQRVGDAGLLVEGYCILGASLFGLGHLAAARLQLEASIATYDPEKHRSHALVYGQDPKVLALTYLVKTVCPLGYPDLGLSRSQEMLSLARSLAHPFSLTFALYGSSMVRVWRQEWRAAQAFAEEFIALCAEQGLSHQESQARCLLARVLVQQGAGATGAGMLRRSLAELKAMGPGNMYLLWLPWSAEAFGRMGQAEEGLSELGDAFRLLGRSDQRYAESELYWIKGTLLEQLASPDADEAEASYLKAIEVARHQQTKLLELRAATSLCRIWQRQGKRAEARELLAPIYLWFTEGFDTPDLKDAKALLDALA